MSTQQKVQYPGVGCVVEFMQGNSPMLAFVTEEQGGKLRLFTMNQRETSLPAARLLPWSGPVRGAGLSRQSICTALEEHKKTRESIRQEIDIHSLWELVQGEVPSASSEWLAGLLWENPTIDHEAALGCALLEAKNHFRFLPPDFEIFTEEKAALRIHETEVNRQREELVGAGATFFKSLWEAYQKGQRNIFEQSSFAPPLAEKLEKLLFSRMADPENPENETLWKQLCRGLPEHPHLALCLSIAWGLVPEHYNDLADRADFTLGDEWALAFPGDCAFVQKGQAACLADGATRLEDMPDLFSEPPCFITMDPAGSQDRDDAFYVERDREGNFHLFVALACPAACWPFENPLDKAVLRRATSLYLPEGDEHMIAPDIGWKLFSLDSETRKPVLLAEAVYDSEGEPLHFSLHSGTLAISRNFTLEEGEEALASLAGETETLTSAPESTAPAQIDWAAVFHDTEGSEDGKKDARPLPDQHPAASFLPQFRDALALAKLLQQKRITGGAVITERPDPFVRLETQEGKILVSIEEQPPFLFAQLVVSEFMIATNQLGALWAGQHGVPLLYRTQDVAVPKEFSGIWRRPEDISRVIKSLPSASLEARPRKHAGLGISAYASYTSPMRRYIDLLNQGQIIRFLQSGTARLSQEELEGLLPLINSRTDSVNQVQRMRPRYWKLLFFRQQGDKKWWPGVVTEETPTSVFVSLPWAQFFLRGKRALFSEKLTPGQHVDIRIGKVNPLLNDIQIIEVRDA